MGTVPAFSRDATTYRPLSVEYFERKLDPRCFWREDGKRCGKPCIDDTPVCLDHAIHIATRVMDVLRQRNEEPPADGDRWPTHEEIYGVPEGSPLRIRHKPFVYYLMLSPTTVKIGTTRDLRTRIKSHGGELQYVVALEHGSYDVEKARHDQFPMERHGTKEVFTLSDELRKHIETMAPQRDALVELALTLPREDR